MILIRAASEFLCGLFSILQECKRDEQSGMNEIRESNAKFMEAHRRVNPNPYVQSYYILSRPGSGIGTPGVVRFSRFQYPSTRITLQMEPPLLPVIKEVGSSQGNSQNVVDFDSADYEPQPDDAVNCSKEIIECVSGFVDTVVKSTTVQDAIFSCDTEDLCQAIGSNSCEYDNEGTMTCCCDTDLCNNGRKYAPIPSEMPVPSGISKHLTATISTIITIFISL